MHEWEITSVGCNYLYQTSVSDDFILQAEGLLLNCFQPQKKKLIPICDPGKVKGPQMLYIHYKKAQL